MRGSGWIVAGMAVLAVHPSGLAAQAGRSEVAEGNRLYAEKKYQEAHERYLDALRESPDSPLIRFNEANALYKTEEFARALEAYRQAVQSDDPALQSKAWYNLGNALYRQQMLQESLEAYKQAMRVDPDDVDAKRNFEYVLDKLQQQEQQQQQRGDSGEGEQQQQDDQQNPDQPPDSSDGQQQKEQRNQGQEQPEDSQQPQPDQGPQPQMSREEAQRLLQAINEDPNKIRRKGQKVAGVARRKKTW